MLSCGRSALTKRLLLQPDDAVLASGCTCLSGHLRGTAAGCDPAVAYNALDFLYTNLKLRLAKGRAAAGRLTGSLTRRGGQSCQWRSSCWRSNRDGWRMTATGSGTQTTTRTRSLRRCRWQQHWQWHGRGARSVVVARDAHAIGDSSWAHPAPRT